MYFVKLIAIIFIFSITQNNSFAAEKDSVTILVPQNMSFAITEIIRNYSRNNEIVVTGSFNTLKTLISDIEEGFPADIIITDHPDWIKHLKQRGLLNISSITNLVEDKLVLVTNKAYYNLNQEIFEKVSNSDNETKRKFYDNFTIVIPDKTSNLIGSYAEEVIEKSNIFNQKSEIVRNNNIKKLVINEQNTIGITNYTDTYDNPDINILETFDRNLHQRFIYQIALIASENMQGAEDFIKFLKSEETLSILKKYGFEVIQ